MRLFQLEQSGKTKREQFNRVGRLCHHCGRRLGAHSIGDGYIWRRSVMFRMGSMSWVNLRPKSFKNQEFECLVNIVQIESSIDPTQGFEWFRDYVRKLP